MRRSVASALGLAAVLVVAACSDQPRPVRIPTEPSLAKQPPGGTCSNDLYNTLTSEARSLFDGAVENGAIDQLRAIKNSCPNVPAAHTYVAYVIANKDPMNITRATALSLHVDHVFAYVGAGTPGVPSNAWFLGAAICEIASGVDANCVANNVATISDPDDGLALAGLHQTANSTPVGNHLYSIVRNDSPGCLGTNLGRSMVPCYNFAVFPAVTPKFDPPLQVFICTTDHSGTDITTSIDAPLRTLGHKKTVGGTVALKRFPADNQAYAAQCSHGDPPPYASVSPMGSVLRQFVTATLRPFRPTTAFAVNGGLGITDDFGEGFSPIGDVKLLMFRDNFNGAPPIAAEVGAWTDSVQAPGSITVVSSLGDLTDKPIVLNQAQGACNQCPVLLHKGTMFNASGSSGDAGYIPANLGTYVVRFQSLQNKPSVKSAPVIVESFETSGPPSSRSKEIARLAYSTESSQRILRYNGTVITGIPWVQNVHQSFEITVDVTNKTTSLKICGADFTPSGCTSPAAFQGVQFVNTAATNFNDIAWRFSGVDAGILAVDNVSITRAVDP